MWFAAILSTRLAQENSATQISRHQHLCEFSSHFVRDSSLLHGSGASLIHGRSGTVVSFYRTSASPTGSAAATSAAAASSSGPSLVGQDLNELRYIVDTRVMEKILIFDGNEAHFAMWRFTFEATCGLLGLEQVLRQSVLSTHDDASLNVFAQQAEVSLKNKAVYYLLVVSCQGQVQVLVRGVCMSRMFEVGSIRCWLELSLLCGGKETHIRFQNTSVTSVLGTLGSRYANETAARWSILRFGWQ